MQPAATILIVKSGISNHAASGILDELCFSKFGAFHAACPQSADNFRTYVQHLPCSRIKHNRAKPMFELASALFSIADANEFRFARFYIVYEEARLVLLGSPLIVCELPDIPRGLSKRGKTQHSMPDAARKNYLDFTPKNSPLPVTLERCVSLTSQSIAYLLHVLSFAGCFRTQLCRFREPPECADCPQLTDQYRNHRLTARSVWKAACR